jgi:HEAT repeat protein
MRASIALREVDMSSGWSPPKMERRSLAELSKSLQDPQSKNRSLILGEVAEMGSEARELTPVLLQMLDDERKANARDLSWLEAPILEALSRIGEPRELILPVFRNESRSRNLVNATKASWWLWKVGEGDASFLLHVLTRFLREHVSDTKYNGHGYFHHERHEAAHLLAEMGPEAKSALPALRRALWDPEQQFRPHVAYAIWRIEGDPALEEAVEAMIDALGDRPHEAAGSHEYTCRAVGACLGRIGPGAVPLILPHLDDEDEYVRLGLIEALERIGPAAAPARSAIEARLEDPHPLVRAEAARALSAIDTAPISTPGVRAPSGPQ